MSGTPNAPMRVLVVDDDPVALTFLDRYLTSAGHDVVTARNGLEALRIIATEDLRLVITDWMMPEMDGLQLCRAIRQHEGIPFAYLIIVTAHSNEDRLIEAFDAGADDYATKPVNRRELMARVRAGERFVRLQEDLDRRSREVHLINAEMAITHQKLAEANEALDRLATTDELTGLSNRREAMAKLTEHWAFAERHHTPLACVALDIDHFKKFNDTFGHAVGDLVLAEMAATLQKHARQEERICRVGGEEFLVLCPQATTATAAIGAERLRKAVESATLKTDETELKITVSLGIAERTPETQIPDDMLREADDALYAAKAAGRNRVCVAGDKPKPANADNSCTLAGRTS